MAKRNAPKPKSVFSYLRAHVPETLIVSGFVLFVTSLTHNYLRLRSLTLDNVTVQAYFETALPTAPTPVHIFIPWNTDADLAPGVYQEGSWTVSPDKVTYLASSAMPGQGGNTIIYGHNKREILGNIRVLKGGETITLTLSDGTLHNYRVQNAQELSPTQTFPLLPTNTEVITLFTCSGPLDSRRYVVQALPLANPVDGSPSSP